MFRASISPSLSHRRASVIENVTGSQSDLFCVRIDSTRKAVNMAAPDGESVREEACCWAEGRMGGNRGSLCGEQTLTTPLYCLSCNIRPEIGTGREQKMYPTLLLCEYMNRVQNVSPRQEKPCNVWKYAVNLLVQDGLQLCVRQAAYQHFKDGFTELLGWDRGARYYPPSW